MDLANLLQPPGAEGHILGTDDLGRDIWCRLLYGGRTSVLTGLIVALITAVVGVGIGLISGYFGGVVETLLMRFTDIMLSFPFLIVAIAIMAALGSSQRNIILALAIVGWPRFARLTRGQVLAVKQSEYVDLSGLGRRRGRAGLGHHAQPGPELLAAGPLPDHNPRHRHFRHRAGHELDRRRPARRL